MDYKSDTVYNRTGNGRITYQVAHSRKHCCYGNTIMLSLYIVVELLVAVNNVKPLSVAMETQEWGIPCAAAEVQNISHRCQQHKRTLVFGYNARYFCPIVTKFGAPRHISVKSQISNFMKNWSCGNRADACGKTDERTGMTKGMCDFRYIFERA